MGLMDKILGKDDDDDKKKADFSNVRSGSSSTAPAPLPGAPAPGTPPGSAAGGRTYTVKAGDSLSKIAQREYGDASQWKRIHEANKDLIKNPDLIHPGQTLKLP